MSTPLTLYPVNSPSSVLTNAGLLVAASGSTTTAAPTTLVGTATGWGEIAWSGNAGPWAAAGTEPAPTGYGACFDASSSVLVAQMLLAGNWSGVLKLFTNGTTTSLSFDHLKLRFWKYNSATAVYTAIGSIDLGIQTLNTTATAFTFPSTAEALMTFGGAGNGYLYIDCVGDITSGTATTATTKIKMDIGGSSTSQGNANYTIGSPGYQPTPALSVDSGTLSFSDVVGGTNPANQPVALSETSGTGTAWTSLITYGSGSGWLAISPLSDTLAAGGTSETVTFSCTTGALAAGTYTATVTFTATTGGAQVSVTVTFNVKLSGALSSSAVVAYADSPYAMTRYVSNQRTPLTYDSLALFASFTQGGTIPFYVRYQYSWNLIENAHDANGNPIYDWGPLDETVDKITSTPGLRFIFNLAYAPAWRQAIDANGKWVGYNASTAILAGGPDMARFATDVTTRYKSFVQSGQIILEIGNEEYDTALAGSVGGTILAYTMNYAIPAIKSIVPAAIVVAGSVRPGSHPNGAGTLQWMNNFYTYVPGTISGGKEPAQSLPDVHDMHFYDNSNVVEKTTPKAYAPDPTVTDNSSDYTKAVKVPIQGVLSIMSGVLQKYNSNCQIWNLENGYSLPNCSPNNHNNSPTNLPSQQDDYTIDMMVQQWYANVGAKYAVYSMLDQGNDPRALYGTALSDFASFMSSNPQWTGNAPQDRLYRSVTALSFEGTPATAPPVQYFSIGNPTTTAQSWQITHDKSWLTAVTVPTNGYGGTGGGATSGTLQPGQWITLKCSADSTQSGLATSTPLSGTLSIAFGNGVTKTIAISLWVAPTAASPQLTSASSTNNGGGAGPTFTMAVNATPPAALGVNFKNADTYDTGWYAFTTCNWFSIDVSSGVLTAGSSQTITISINSIASSLAPGTYNESLTISATPFPPTYTSPTTSPTQFITINVKLTVQVAHSPTVAVQVSIPTLLYSATASGSLPVAQTFYLHNCTNASEPWTVAKTQSWLTLDHTSSSTNLPANGANNGATYPKATDYFVITASINTTALSAGTYTDTITVTLNPGANQAQATIAVTYVVTGSGTGGTLVLGSSPTSLSYSATAGGSDPATQTLTLTNSGTATGTYTSKITYTSGTGWLTTLTPGSHSLSGGGGNQVVTVGCSTGSLAAGTYAATITFTLAASGLTSSQVQVNISFTVNAQSTPANFTVSPTALAFSATVNSTNPAPQILTISNTGGAQGTWNATIIYTNGGDNQGWLTLSPLSGQLAVGASTSVSVFADDTNLTVASTYTATITITGPNNTVTVNVSFVIAPQAPPAGGALSNLLSLAVQKTQVVKVYDQFGNFINVWRDAPLLTGLKSTMNAADSQVKMVLPRKIDAYGGAGQPNTDNSVVVGNNVQIWLYGPGLPTTGLLKLNGVLDIVEPTIDASNAESVTVTITPYGSIVADHGFPGTITFTNVDPLYFFTYWFNTNDPTPGLGNVPYANPLTLSSASTTSSGLGGVTYTIQNTPMKSVFDTVMFMLGAGWFWRANPDTSVLITQLPPVAQHILYLGQHMASMTYSIDNSNRKNVICFVGSTNVIATAVGASAVPPSQGGLGERIAYYQDSRITDKGSAQIMANGLLSLLDQPLIRIKCRIFDYRGDTRKSLGYDIESINVGDTVSIRDVRQMGFPTTWGTFKWGYGTWGKSPGIAFNQIVPVLNIDYNWNYIDVECGTFQPSQDRSIFKIRSILQDFTVGQP